MTVNEFINTAGYGVEKFIVKLDDDSVAVTVENVRVDEGHTLDLFDQDLEIVNWNINLFTEIKKGENRDVPTAIIKVKRNHNGGIIPLNDMIGIRNPILTEKDLSNEKM